MLKWFWKKREVPVVEPGTQEVLHRIGDEIQIAGVTLGVAYVDRGGAMFSIAPEDCPKIRLPHPGDRHYSPPFRFAPLPRSRKVK